MSVSGSILECLESAGRRGAGRGSSTSVGRPTCFRIRCTTDACSMSATRPPPHRSDCRDEPAGHPRAGVASRPGFDRQVTVGNPDLKGGETILRVDLRSICAWDSQFLGRGSGQPRQRSGTVRRVGGTTGRAGCRP